eukprot:3942966-Alexandrium_andersonii.AAC.1
MSGPSGQRSQMHIIPAYPPLGRTTVHRSRAAFFLRGMTNVIVSGRRAPSPGAPPRLRGYW